MRKKIKKTKSIILNLDKLVVDFGLYFSNNYYSYY